MITFFWATIPLVVPVPWDGKTTYSICNGMFKVVHCKKSPYDVYIGRPSKWGNPFVIGKDGDRDEVVRKYEEWIRTQPNLMKDLVELKGKILGCWCYPQACHGDVLVRLANEQT